MVRNEREPVDVRGARHRASDALALHDDDEAEVDEFGERRRDVPFVGVRPFSELPIRNPQPPVLLAAVGQVLGNEAKVNSAPR